MNNRLKGQLGNYELSMLDLRHRYDMMSMPAGSVRVLSVGGIEAPNQEIPVTFYQVMHPSGALMFAWSLHVEGSQGDQLFESDRAFPTLSQAIDDGIRALVWLQGGIPTEVN